jgi:vancomycin resistance protein YoaR
VSKAKKIAIGTIIGVLMLLGGAYVAAYFVAGNQLPAKATVEGVSLGGLSPDQAEEKLAAELAPQLDAPINVNSGATSVAIDPAESGLGADYEATVRAAGGGFSWHPADILRTFTGGDEVELVRLVDEGRLRESVESIAPEFAIDGTDATIAFEQGELVRTDARDAQELDVDETAASVREAYEGGAGNVEATVVTTPPTVTNAMVDQVVADFVDPLLSGPIPVTHEEQTMEVVPAAVAAATTFTVEGDRIVPEVDAEILFEETGEARRALELSDPKDAGFSFSGGTISVVPAVAGETIEPGAFKDAVLAAAVKTGAERTASIDVTVQQPEFTTEQAEQLKPTEVIGEFTTRYPHAAYRNTNLGRAATSVNGTVLMPGEIFSLNDTLGPRTADNGYVDGYVINEGRLVKEGGGGISQAATTLYNAAFFAGYEDIEHKPHSLYFDRYPAGREATIYYGALDMRFRNDTEFPAVIQGYTNPSSPGERGSITFKIWSQRTYDKVESTELVKSDFYTGQDRILKGEPDCEPQAPIRGFTVTWKRLFYKGGQVVKEEPYRWKYSAGDRIICEP